jgi:glutamate/aspartate transport system substrate-binding protein
MSRAGRRRPAVPPPPRSAAALARVAALALLLLAIAAPPGATQTPSASPGPPGALTGTLRAASERGRLTLGFRESSLPFSYLNPLRQPIGYSIDLCLAVVDAVREELGREVAVDWRPVTPETRILELVAGRIDLECGSTTVNAEREKQVAFSPVFFVAGTRLLVRRDSPIRGFADLAGRTVVATAGTTNLEAVRTLAARQRLAVTVVTEPDHAQSFNRLAAGQADAFALDDVLLYGLVATVPGGGNFRVSGPLLSFEPYGLMFRRDDPAFASLVGRTFERLAQSRELGEIYGRWFNRRLPTGELLNLPMGPQLTELFRMLGAPE